MQSEAEAKPEWKAIRGLSTNYILEADDFYISYAPNAGSGISFFGSDDGDVETALVKKNRDARGTFYILNGDWREDYERLLPEGFDACKRFYEEKKDEHRSSWSED